MRKALSYLMVPVQIFLMGIGTILTFVFRIPQLWMRYVYYGWVKLKRRVAGEEAWQEHDALIGYYPPKDHPFWKKLPSLVADDDPEPPRAA